MCGIAGILSSDIDLRGEKLLVEKMGKTLKKRGPDAAGLYLHQRWRLFTGGFR